MRSTPEKREVNVHMEECGARPARTELLSSSALHELHLSTGSSSAKGGSSIGGFVATASESSGGLGVGSVTGSDAAVLSDQNIEGSEQFTICVLGAVSSKVPVGTREVAHFFAVHSAHKPKTHKHAAQ